MGKYLLPLKIFVVGNILLLAMWIMLPQIGTAGEDLAANTAEHASIFWGWSWVSNSVKLLVVVIGELIVLFITGKAFLSSKD